jgi:hypothetical protein
MSRPGLHRVPDCRGRDPTADDPGECARVRYCLSPDADAAWAPPRIHGELLKLGSQAPLGASACPAAGASLVFWPRFVWETFNKHAILVGDRAALPVEGGHSARSRRAGLHGSGAHAGP